MGYHYTLARGMREIMPPQGHIMPQMVPSGQLYPTLTAPILTGGGLLGSSGGLINPWTGEEMGLVNDEGNGKRIDRTALSSVV